MICKKLSLNIGLFERCHPNRYKEIDISMYPLQWIESMSDILKKNIQIDVEVISFIKSLKKMRESKYFQQIRKLING